MRIASPEVYIAVLVFVAVMMLLTERGRDIFIGTLTTITIIGFMIVILPFALAFDVFMFIVMSLLGKTEKYEWLIPYMINELNKKHNKKGVYNE